MSVSLKLAWLTPTSHRVKSQLVFPSDPVRHRSVSPGQGFSGDGYTCRPSISCYDEPTQCDVNAACVPDLDGFRCVCLKGFVGDGRCLLVRRPDVGVLRCSLPTRAV